tara:strand:- start:10548 stop:10754 length:207 start_codon:yes stop_codon:yes gene_type:complete
MSTNEELKQLMANIPLTQAKVKEFTESGSIETIKGWCAAEGSSRYRNMPASKMKLLKLELRDCGLLKS